MLQQLNMDIRPIRTNEELEGLHRQAAEDNHMLAWPTHNITRDGASIGALSIIPSVIVWLDTRKARIRDAITMQTYYEGLLANTARCVLVPCALNSPLLPYMGRAGYIEVGTQKLFIKGI